MPHKRTTHPYLSESRMHPRYQNNTPRPKQAHEAPKVKCVWASHHKATLSCQVLYCTAGKSRHGHDHDQSPKHTAVRVKSPLLGSCTSQSINIGIDCNLCKINDDMTSEFE
jgi:hypothetical protein